LVGVSAGVKSSASSAARRWAAAVTVRHAIGVSVAVHAAVIGAVLLNGASIDNRGLAKPPVSSLQARVLTYENGDSPGASPAEAVADLATAAAAPALQPLPLLPVEAARPVQKITLAATEPIATAPAPEVVRDSGSLDASPVLISTVTLEYPLSANNREGLVTLAITVAGDGRVDDVQVVRAIPPGFFEAAALDGFRSARFTPGMLGGVGVKSRMLIEVEFMPTNRGGLGIK
jgi:TonB family protein